MTIENKIKGISIFYWANALILFAFTFLFLFLVQSSQPMLMNGLFVFLSLGSLSYCISFAHIGWNLWRIKAGAATRAISSSATLIGLFVFFLLFSLDQWQPLYFIYLGFFSIHILSIWLLTRQDIKDTFGSN